MGLVYADLELSNPSDRTLSHVQVKALVDSGAIHLCIPRETALQLGLNLDQKRTVTLADGTTQEVPYAGPIEVKFANRRCYVGALVLGNQALLGAVPMEDMDVIIHPARRQLEPNPAHPNIAGSIAMGNRPAGAK